LIDRAAILAAYDEQVRKHPSGERILTWAELGDDPDAAIAAQVERFAGGGEWEWKHYSHDAPADLPARLLAAGFTAEPAETLMVAEVATIAREVAPPEGVELRPVADAAGVAALVGLHDEVFGGDHAALERAVLAGLAEEPPSVVAVVALAGGTPVCGGRVEFYEGTEFAGLWGGGTLPGWRGRGIFRALVAYRARLAAERGFRYLQVDASPDSRPILARLGFSELATTTPFIHP
jgi:GNAT superfamily N-acetyltransferase